MTCFLDFDHTLFNTDQFFRVELPLVLAPYQIDQAVWKQTYALVQPQGYSLVKHLSLLAETLDLPKEEIVGKVMDHFHDGSKFVFPDVVDFLDTARRHGATLALLSFGAQEWQHYKLEMSGLKDYFDEIFITAKPNAKQEVINLHKGLKPFIMVDNNAEELDAILQVDPSVRTYWINRVPEALREPKNDLEVAMFEGARKYLRYIPTGTHTICQSLAEINL